ncbi:hypothetical protein Tco_1372662 [Tanacetum coccineum]
MMQWRIDAGSSYVSTAGPSNVSAAGPSTSTAGDIFEDEMTIIANTLVAIRSARPRTTSVMICNVEKEPKRATPVLTIQSQDKGKGKMVEAQIQMDEELAQREQFTIDEQARMLVDLIAKRKKFFAAQKAEQIRNKPPTRAQLKNKMEQKWINNFVPLDSEMVKDSSKEDGDSQKQTKSRDDIAMDFESLATKYPIIDWKTHILTENMMYYQIIRADESSKNYKIFSGMLDDFDRQDVIDLYRLVKERYETTSPEGYDLLLWGDLKNLLEPSKEDEIWKNQQDYNLISLRLFDSCRVHVLLMDTRIAIHMMVENAYPLTQEMLSRMLNRRLEVDHQSEMAFKLLRFTRSQLQK